MRDRTTKGIIAAVVVLMLVIAASWFKSARGERFAIAEVSSVSDLPQHLAWVSAVASPPVRFRHCRQYRGDVYFVKGIAAKESVEAFLGSSLVQLGGKRSSTRPSVSIRRVFEELDEPPETAAGWLPSYWGGTGQTKETGDFEFAFDPSSGRIWLLVSVPR